VLQRTRERAQEPVRLLLSSAEAEVAQARIEAADVEKRAMELASKYRVELSERLRVRSTAHADAEQFELAKRRLAERVGQRRSRRLVRPARWIVRASTLVFEAALFLGWSPLGVHAPILRWALIAVGLVLLGVDFASDRVDRWFSRLERGLARRATERELRLWVDEPPER
jgi:hypothetical protein